MGKATKKSSIKLKLLELAAEIEKLPDSQQKGIVKDLSQRILMQLVDQNDLSMYKDFDSFWKDVPLNGVVAGVMTREHIKEWSKKVFNSARR